MGELIYREGGYYRTFLFSIFIYYFPLRFYEKPISVTLVAIMYFQLPDFRASWHVCSFSDKELADCDDFVGDMTSLIWVAVTDPHKAKKCFLLTDLHENCFDGRNTGLVYQIASDNIRAWAQRESFVAWSENSHNLEIALDVMVWI